MPLFIVLSNTELVDDIVSEISEMHESWLATNETTHMIHYIIDLCWVKNYPRNILEIKRNLHTRMGHTDWILFVSEDYFLKHLGAVLARLLKYRFRQYSSVRDAYCFLQETEGTPLPMAGIDNLDDIQSRR